MMDYRIWRNLKTLCHLAIAVMAASAIPIAGATEPTADGPFDPDRAHPWNRLFTAFFVREMDYPEGFRSNKSPKNTPPWLGPEVLDPPLGLHPKFLLDDEPYAKCNAALDEFLNKKADGMIRDPLKRAILQRDLWAVFDLLQRKGEDFMRNFGENPKPYTPVQQEHRAILAGKIARVMASLALSREQLEALPDTYRAAVNSGVFPRSVANQAAADYLPPNLFDPDGPWVELSDKSPSSPSGFAPFQHTSIVEGRSVFRVFFGPPPDADGAKRLSKWLTAVSDAAKLPSGDDRTHRRRNEQVDAALAQVPVGTHFLLLRQMICIDDKKEIVPVRVVESVQLRVYRTPHAREALQSQLFEEFEMNRALLFSNRQGGLRATPGGEPHPFGYVALGRLATDENGRTMAFSPFPENCLACHVQTEDRHQVKPADIQPQILSLGRLLISLTKPAESKVAAHTARWKSEQPGFKRLTELMNERNPAPPGE